MPKKDDINRSILIVSSSEKFDLLVKRSLAGFITIDSRKTVSLARRAILERNYDLVVINAPMPDETGVEFALDVSEKRGTMVLIVAPEEVYGDVSDRVTDHGVMVLSKPITPSRFDRGIRFLVAMTDKLHQYEKKAISVEEKMEEIRIVSKAKILLVEKKHMTEDEAHRFIGKQAMNNGVSRRVIAEKIIDDYE